HHNYIGTEHLLLGLLHDDEALACRVLRQFGIGLEAARQEVISALANPLTWRLEPLTGTPQGTRGLRRYNLVLPEALLREVQGFADAEQTTVVELLRRFIKLGLLASRIADTPGSALIIREGDREREILML